MTATTIRQVEAAPESWPPVPWPISDVGLRPLPEAVWRRIESWIAHRFTERAVVWTVEGPGEWSPPLTPATIETVERWQGDQWADADPLVSPLGLELPGGTYRITATVGGGDVPAPVNEAYRRLAEYIGQKPGKAGATSERASAGSVSFSTRRSAAWMAEAMANSGAADLLRPYRRA